MKGSPARGSILAPIEFDTGVEVTERHGPRAELAFHAAEVGVPEWLMVAWADTEEDRLK